MFKSGDLIPKTVFAFLKLAIFIIVFYIVLNLMLFLSFYEKAQTIARLVQNSVELHNYLPAVDYKAIQGLIDDMMKNTEKDESEFGITLPGINRVVTNMQIAVWDSDKKGYRSATSLEDFHTDALTDNDGPGYYIGESGMRHKKQNGEILYAGIVFEYHFLIPMPFYDEQFTQGYYDGGINFSTDGDAYYGTYKDARQKFNEDIDFDTYAVNTDNEETNNGLRLFGMKPVICKHFYSDIDQEKYYDIATGEEGH